MVGRCETVEIGAVGWDGSEATVVGSEVGGRNEQRVDQRSEDGTRKVR